MIVSINVLLVCLFVLRSPFSLGPPLSLGTVSRLHASRQGQMNLVQTVGFDFICKEAILVVANTREI